MGSGSREAVFAALLGVLGSSLASTAEASDLRILETRRAIRALHEAIDAHREATGEWPGDARQLGTVARIYAPGVAQEEGRPLDAWGRPLRYAPPAAAHADAESAADAGYRLYSDGPDGRDAGGEGDDVRAAPSTPAERAMRRARALLPLAALCAVAPIAWAVLRHGRRQLG